ncbi:unnamed protein product [Gadus morhua 'NCC']
MRTLRRVAMVTAVTMWEVLLSMWTEKLRRRKSGRGVHHERSIGICPRRRLWSEEPVAESLGLAYPASPLDYTQCLHWTRPSVSTGLDPVSPLD